MIELRLDRLQRRQQAVGADLIEHLPHLVRLLARLAEQAALAELEQHAFGARRYQGLRGPDQDLAGQKARAGYVLKGSLAGLETLEDLLQVVTMSLMFEQ